MPEPGRPAPAPLAPPPAPSYRLVMAGLITAALAFSLMQTFLIPALPELQRSLGTSQTWITWTITAYLLTSSVAIPLLGRLGDQHGKARLMVVSLAVFLVGSVAAIFAPNVGMLIAARAVQGVGGAVFPLSYGIVRDQLPPERHAVAMGLISSVLGLGGGIGIVASGVVIDHLSWRYLFVVSAAVVAIALVLVWRFVPESTVRAPARVDAAGAVLLSGGLVTLLLAISEGRGWGWSSPAVLGLLGASASLLAAWWRVELRVREPMVDVRMLVSRPVLATNLTALLSGFALYLTWVILPGLYQLPRGLPDSLARLGDYGFGTSVTVAGLWILPTSATILVTGPIAGLMGRRRGSREPLVAGMALMALGAVGIALWHAEPWQPALAFTLMGAGVGFSFAAMPRLVTDAVRASETAVANGMNTVVRTVGGVVGSQVGAVLLAASAVAGTTVPSESGYTAAFWVSAAVAALGAAAATLVPRRPRPAPAADSLRGSHGGLGRPQPR